MGKTYRKYTDSPWRRPKGHKQALVQEARKIPPSAWDDLGVSNESLAPWKTIEHLVALGMSEEDVCHKVCRKFSIDYQLSLKLYRRAVKWNYLWSDTRTNSQLAEIREKRAQEEKAHQEYLKKKIDIIKKAAERNTWYYYGTPMLRAEFHANQYEYLKKHGLSELFGISPLNNSLAINC